MKKNKKCPYCENGKIRNTNIDNEKCNYCNGTGRKIKKVGTSDDRRTVQYTKKIVKCDDCNGMGYTISEDDRAFGVGAFVDCPKCHGLRGGPEYCDCEEGPLLSHNKFTPKDECNYCHRKIKPNDR